MDAYKTTKIVRAGIDAIPRLRGMEENSHAIGALKVSALNCQAIWWNSKSSAGPSLTGSTMWTRPFRREKLFYFRWGGHFIIMWESVERIDIIDFLHARSDLPPFAQIGERLAGGSIS